MDENPKQLRRPSKEKSTSKSSPATKNHSKSIVVGNNGAVLATPISDLCKDTSLAESPSLATDSSKGSDRSTTTLFVRNVPFESSKSQLQDFFADNFGPLQTCFLVTKHDANGTEGRVEVKSNQSHAGYGFVQFAVKEDAEKGVHALTQRHGVKKFMGRRLKVEFALRRHLQNMKQQENKPVKAIKQVKEKDESIKDESVKKFVVHAQIAGGILAEKALEARLRKAAGKPTLLSMTGSTARVEYTKEAEATRVIKKLNNRPFQVKGQPETFTLQLALLDAHLKAHRLIVRNLPFDIARQTLMDTFLPHGSIVEVELPLQADGKTQRGFGFIQYMQASEAEHAIRALNGNKIGRRPVAVDWAVSIRDFKKRASETNNAEDDESLAKRQSVGQ